MISYFANPPLPVATAVSPTWNSILTIICLILLSQFLATIIFKLLDNEYQIHKKALRMHHLFSYHLYHANHNPSLKYYLEYMIYQKDDRPLYLFESAIESQEIIKKMLKKYEIPEIF